MNRRSKCPRGKYGFGILVALAAAGGTVRAQTGSLSAAWNTNGLAALTWGEHALLKNGTPAIRNVILESRTLENGLWKESFQKPEIGAAETAFDAGQNRLSLFYPWAGLVVNYSAGVDRLDMAFVLSNRSDRILAHFELIPLQLILPEAVEQPKQWTPMVAMPGEPGVVEARVGSNRLLLCSDTVQPLSLGFGKPENGGSNLPVVVKGGVRMMDPGGVQFFAYGLPRIAPGQTISFRLSLVFATRESSPPAPMEAALEAFQRYHSPRLYWPDRRPIAAIFLPTSKGPENNPRNWFNKKDLDVRTEEGRTELRRLMMKFADGCIAQLNAMNAQGMIVWNPEGGENPHPITYIGDPRMVRLLAPEMEDILPDFFARIREAGFRVGCCLRPTQVYFDEKKGAWAHGTGSHGPDRNPLGDDFSAVWPAGLPWWRFYPVVERMSRKIEFARTRWGATLFYVDTNGLFANEGEEGKMSWTLLDSQIWRELNRRHPDVLLVPELRRSSAQYAYTAQYLQPPYSPAVTPPRIRSLFPGAFSVSYTVNLKADEWDNLRETLIEGVRQGDSFFFRGWFSCGYTPKIKTLYDAVYPPKAINPGLPAAYSP